MKVLIWATTLQADILSLVYYLNDVTPEKLLVVTQHPEKLRPEPIQKYRPLKTPPLSRESPGLEEKISQFHPDVTVFDNHPPSKKYSPKICSMWHGLGWKARSEEDINNYHRKIKSLTGISPIDKNPFFKAQCYGEPDKAWRVDQWGVHPDNCMVVGMSFSDMLLDPPYTKEDLVPYYPALDLLNRKTALINFTWHYGSWVPGHWRARNWFVKNKHNEDIKMLSHVLDFLSAKRVNGIIGMHDRRRYQPSFLKALEELLKNRPDVMIKFKSDHPDNLADLVVADLMVSNLSSYIVFYYVLQKPAIHLLPNAELKEDLPLATLKWGRIAKRKPQKNPLWMNAPDDVGGLAAHNLSELINALDKALDRPEDYAASGKEWLNQRVTGLDGRTAARFYKFLKQWVCEDS